VERIFVDTNGQTDIIDLTEKIYQIIKKKGFQNGVVNLFVIGSTAAITTIEIDKNLYQDLREILEKIIPYQKNYHHHQTWGDDNGASHLRASLFGPSLSFPVINRKPFLGTWQKIVLIDFDTKPRQREVIINFLKT